MYLIDTNVISELRRVERGKGDARVASWQARVDPMTCFISVITLMEVEIGVLRMERRDHVQGALLRRWLEQGLCPAFAERTFGVDADVARRAAPLHIPNPSPPNDALIAATALVHGMTVVTRNIKDFSTFGVSLLNPWEPPALHQSRASYRVSV